MADLALPSLSFTIEADGRAAIQELDRVSDAATGAESKAQAAYQKTGTAAEGAAQKMKSVGDEAEKTGKKTADAAEKAKNSIDAVADKMSKLGKTMSVAVTAPLLAAFTACVKGAADLTETLGKTEVVFGGYFDRIMSWSDNAVTTMGIAQSTALEMASLYGDMATGMGFAQGAAADMSMQLTRLAADLASFKNISIDMAQTALKSVFTGETESLKNLGVVMTQTNLEAYALAQGIGKSIDSMTQAEKVTLRYNYVLSQTQNAQGDFVRTGDSLSNQSRKLGETIKQTSESFGGLLAPAITDVIVKIQQMVQNLMELDDGTKTMILSVATVAASIGPLLLVGSKLLKLITAIKTATFSTTPILLGLAAAVMAVVALNDVLGKTQRQADTTSDEFVRLKKIISGGIDGKVTVNTDDLDGLEDKEITVTINGDGQKALDEASKIIATLKTDDYKGLLTIDGDAGKAEDALAALETAVQGLLSGNGSIADLEAAIARCEEISVTVDGPAQAAALALLGELRTQLDLIKGGTTITLSADGEAALKEAKSVIDKLQSDDYKGKLIIDGDTQKADSALAALKTAVDNMLAGNGSIGELQAAINACESLIVSPTIDPVTKATLEAELASLQSTLGTLQTVSIVYSASEAEDSDAKAFQAFVDKVNELGWTTQEYTAIGKFEVDANALSNVEEYKTALLEAASATGGYADKVKNLQSILDKNKSEKITEVNTQAAEQIDYQARLLNSGIID